MMHKEGKDLKGDTSVTDRLCQIPMKSGRGITKPTFAAGAVLWRDDVHSPKICVIHRPSYDDWSLPKSKLDVGENFIAIAVRKIWEEIDYRVCLGKLVGNVSYPVTGYTRLVWYWTVEVLDGELEQNSKVDEFRWASWNEAEKLLSYDLDRDVLIKAHKRMNKELDTRLILAHRGRAHHYANWNGNDALRPLGKKGRRQVELLVSVLGGFRPEHVYSAEPMRCQDTVAPLVTELDMQVTVDERLGDERWIANQAEPEKTFEDIVALDGVSVIHSQDITIPDLLAVWSTKGALPSDEEALCKRGLAQVLGFNDGVMTAADCYASVLPVK